MYQFTHKELKSKNASDFKHGDDIRVSRYLIHIKWHNGDNNLARSPYMHSFIEVWETSKILGCTPGVRGGWPYYLDDFLGR